MQKRIKLIAALLALMLILSACSSLDVVGKDSVRAFGEVLEVLPPEGSPEEGWVIKAPDGEASFEIHNDALFMTVNAQPFIDAGLDISKVNNISEGNLVFLSPGFDMLNQNIKETPIKQFEAAVNALRSSIGYHTPLDHYNISLGDGNMFEWAKDLQINGMTKENQDKDIVFVLNPEPLIAAGVDPEKVKGWIYTTVNMGMGGKSTEVYKFLKPFDLK